MTINRAVLLLFVILSAPLYAIAETLALAPDVPERYVVQDGDTLWDISATFLTKPWRWPELWEANPGIADPHLIFPGDTLFLVRTDDGPVLKVDRGDGTLKLSPRVRADALHRAVPTIPLQAISQFLDKSLVMEQAPASDAAYVVHGADEHVVTGAGDQVFVVNLEADGGRPLDIYRPGDPYRDPLSGENLGYAAQFVATAELVRPGNPATLFITKSAREVLPGDVVIPRSEQLINPTFHPRAPDSAIDARIIAVIDGVAQIGQHNVVVLSKGATDGLVPGHVLLVHQTPEPVKDPRSGAPVELPSQEAGKLMVFRTFDRVSFGLVMTANRAIHLLDKVTNP